MGSESSNGRDRNGRFTNGNPGGPGRPQAGAAAKLQEAVRKACKPEDVASVLQKLRDRSLEGDVNAARVFLAYTVGKPVEARQVSTVPIDLPDLVDVEACQRASKLVLEALMAGQVDTAAAENMRRLIATTTKAIEIGMLIPRLEELERERRWANGRAS